MSKFGNLCPPIDCEVMRSSTVSTISTSLVHNIASARYPEQEHTLVLKFVFQHQYVAGSGNLSKCSYERLDSSVTQPYNFGPVRNQSSWTGNTQRLTGNVVKPRATRGFRIMEFSRIVQRIYFILEFLNLKHKLIHCRFTSILSSRLNCLAPSASVHQILQFFDFLITFHSDFQFGV